MELRINEVSVPGQLTFNYEELKQELMEKVSMYETLVYTDEQIKQAKMDKANLNKLKKALNDERIKREKVWMNPFNAFKTQINDLISITDKPIAVIDNQIKEYEKKQKEDKRTAIKEYWNSCNVPEQLSFEKIFDDKWLNASTSMKSIQDAINEAIDKFDNDMNVLADLPEYAFEAQQTYISTLDVGKALNEAHRLADMAKKKAEMEAEQAKRKAEEEARKAAEQVAVANNTTTEEFIPPVIDREMDAKAFKKSTPEKQWIAFQAYLTTEDALALKDFFNSRNIEFKAV